MPTNLGTERNQRDAERQIADPPLAREELEFQAARERAIDIIKTEAAIRELNAKRLFRTRKPYKGQHLLAAQLMRDAECLRILGRNPEG